MSKELPRLRGNSLMWSGLSQNVFSLSMVYFFRKIPWTPIDAKSLQVLQAMVDPKGIFQDPDNFIEVPSIKGPIDSIYNKTMAYLQTNIVKENVQKVDYKPEAERSFNYPIHALEKIVGNCLYHYDYRKREPITIEIEPDAMYISNPVGGFYLSAF